MRKTVLLILTATFSLFAISLSELDAQRKFVSEGKTELSITTEKEGKSDTRRYDAFVVGDDSLVLFRHESERGTVVLKEQDNLYIKTPTSNATIRITPIQRLFGDASIGDILEIRFSEHYELEKAEGDTVTLKAKKAEATYQKIVLKLKAGKLDSGELYAASGKMLKSVRYEFGKDGKVDKYIFKALGSEGESVVKLLGLKAMKLKKSLFQRSNIKSAYADADAL